MTTVYDTNLMIYLEARGYADIFTFLEDVKDLLEAEIIRFKVSCISINKIIFTIDDYIIQWLW